MSPFLEPNTDGPGCKFRSLQSLRSFLGLASPYRSCLASAPRGRNAPYCSRRVNAEKAAAVEGLLSELLITGIPSAGACRLLETLSTHAVCGKSGWHQNKAPELRHQWLEKLWGEYLCAHGLNPRLWDRPVGPLANDTWESDLEVARGLEYGAEEAADDDYISDDRDDDGLDDSDAFDDGSHVLTPDTTITDFGESDSDEYLPTRSQSLFGASQETEKWLELQEIGHEQMRASLDDLYSQVILDPHGQEEEEADVEAIGSAEEDDDYEEDTHEEAISPAEADLVYVEATHFAEENIDQNPIILGEEKDTYEETNHLAEEEGAYEETVCSAEEEDTYEEPIGLVEEEDAYTEAIHLPEDEHTYKENSYEKAISPAEEEDAYAEAIHLVEGENTYEEATRLAEEEYTYEEDAYEEDAQGAAIGLSDEEDAHEETNSSAKFRRYSKAQSPLDQLKQLLCKLTQTVPHTRRRTGFIYAFARPSLPGFLKIGFVQEKDTADRPCTHPVDRRLAKWQVQCGQPITEVFRRHIACKAAMRIESLVHLTLKEYRQVQHPPCQPCEKRKRARARRAKTAKSGGGGRHNEWFEIDPQTAKRVVDTWASFAEGSPYDRFGRLDDFWAEKIDAEIKRITDTTITRSRGNETVEGWLQTRMQGLLEEHTRRELNSILSPLFELSL
ncbi:hypothetical protein QBC43DRAFT_248802 [Cladorrhinum sp. PSN259]|nr:hypothetical protein QBC43DRAFT_248802 [Cladorrhinum sp. PSN259]